MKVPRHKSTIHLIDIHRLKKAVFSGNAKPVYSHFIHSLLLRGINYKWKSPRGHGEDGWLYHGNAAGTTARDTETAFYLSQTGWRFFFPVHSEVEHELAPEHQA